MKEFGGPGRARPAPPAGQCVPPNPHYQLCNENLAGAVREARDQGNAGPDARGTEQQWLSGPGVGAAAAVTTRVARHTLSILS